MNTGSFNSLDSRAWQDLYKAALFEVDKARLPERIAQAEEALVVRARELFHVAGDNSEEGEALDDAMKVWQGSSVLFNTLLYGTNPSLFLWI